MTTDTPIDLDAVRRTAQAATSGPWTLTDHPNDRTYRITADTGDDDGPALIAILPIHPDDEPDLVRADGTLITAARTLMPAMADEITRLRAELELYRLAVLHMLAHAPDEYRQAITAARASGSSEDYAKNNGRAEMIRIFATGLAQRAGLPVAGWEQIKQGIPADGVYRKTEAAR